VESRQLHAGEEVMDVGASGVFGPGGFATLAVRVTLGVSEVRCRRAPRWCPGERAAFACEDVWVRKHIRHPCRRVGGVGPVAGSTRQAAL